MFSIKTTSSGRGWAEAMANISKLYWSVMLISQAFIRCRDFDARQLQGAGFADSLFYALWAVRSPSRSAWERADRHPAAGRSPLAPSRRGSLLDAGPAAYRGLALGSRCVRLVARLSLALSGGLTRFMALEGLSGNHVLRQRSALEIGVEGIAKGFTCGMRDHCFFPVDCAFGSVAAWAASWSSAS